jgi:pimeloyl-ACP methyl ester carboxylesterase
MSVHHARIPVAGHSLHVAESGDPSGRPYLFLHGWPESWRTWRDVMAAYAYLRRYEAARVVIMNTAIPGVAPWDAVIASPTIWHFGLHAVPGLPETLVRGRQAEYFDHFYDVLSADPSRITPDARAAHAAAYGTDASLTAGFDLYRAFAQDAEDNAALTGPVTTPVLYLRGDGEGGDIAAYAEGFRKAGAANLTTATIRDTGHFSQEEQPAAVWAEIHAFAAREG